MLEYLIKRGGLEYMRGCWSIRGGVVVYERVLGSVRGGVRVYEMGCVCNHYHMRFIRLDHHQ